MFKPLTMVWLATEKTRFQIEFPPYGGWIFHRPAGAWRWAAAFESMAVELVWVTWLQCLLGALLWSFPIERSPQYRPKTCWRNYVFHLTWERLWVHKEEPENAAGDTDVWNTILSFDLTLNKRQLMDGIKTTLKVTHSLGDFLIFAPLFSPVIETYLPSYRTLRSIRW